MFHRWSVRYWSSKYNVPPVVGGRYTDHRWNIVYATLKHLPFRSTDHRWNIGTWHEGCSGEGRPQEPGGCGCGCGCGCRVESKLSQKILLLTYTHTHTHTHTPPPPEDGLPPNTLRARSHISTGGRWPEKEGTHQNTIFHRWSVMFRARSRENSKAANIKPVYTMFHRWSVLTG